MHLLTRVFTELGLLRVQNIDFHYISSSSSVILATFVLSHYVVTVASTTRNLSSPSPSYKRTQIIEFVVRKKKAQKIFYIFNLNNYYFNAAEPQEN